MNSPLFSLLDEAAWHESVRRRELRRCSVALAQLANKIQVTEDFASDTPEKLAKVIRVTAELLGESLETITPAQDLEHVNTILGIITSHLRYVERARVAQIPWSIIQSTEKLLKLVADPKGNFIIRPTWGYNYSIIGEFANFYREFLSCWPWFPFAKWEKLVGFSQDESIYCISFPRIERMNCLLHSNWGHEVGHILAARWVNADFGAAWAKDEAKIKQEIEDHVNKNPPPIDPLFKAMAIQGIVANQMRATMEAAKQGLTELLCDRVGVHILGPSALAASMEFAARFAKDVSPLQSLSYPPWRYRLRKMLEHCEPDLNDHSEIGYPNSDIKAFVEWLRLGQRLTASKGDLQVIESNVITRGAYRFIIAHWDEAALKVTSMLPSELAQPYRLHEHHAHICELVGRLRNGIPPNEISYLSEEPASMQDILAAAWTYKMDQIAQSSWGTPDEYELLFQLVLKACETSYVHSEWGPKIKAGEHEHNI